jgi:hypothetical protein
MDQLSLLLILENLRCFIIGKTPAHGLKSFMRDIPIRIAPLMYSSNFYSDSVLNVKYSSKRSLRKCHYFRYLRLNQVFISEIYLDVA